MDSILQSVRVACGLDKDYDAFDDELLIHINSTFMLLSRKGVGPGNGFAINGTSEEWSSFSDDAEVINGTKQFLGLKVRTLFDPPANSIIKQIFEDQLKEMEWQLYSMNPYYFDDTEREELE